MVKTFEEQKDEFSKITLTQKLEQMRFKEGEDFITVRSGEQFAVTDYPDKKIQNDYMSFGSMIKDPNTGFDTFGGMDHAIYSNNSRNPSKNAIGVARNNDTYCAKVAGQDQFIISKNPDVFFQLVKEYGDIECGMGVPMSNGGYIINDQKRERWEKMKNACELKKQKEDLEKCTSAVQRGDVITLYEPNSEAIGEFRNVFHYKKNGNSFNRISREEAAQYFGGRGYTNNTEQIKASEQVTISSKDIWSIRKSAGRE